MKESRLNDAEKLQREALSIDLHKFGKTSSITARDMRNLGVILTDLEFAEAKKYLDQAIEIHSKNSENKPDPELPIDLQKMAELMISTNQCVEAFKFLEQALAVIDSTNESLMSALLYRISVCLGELNRPTEAVPFLKESISLVKKIDGEDAPKLLPMYEKLIEFEGVENNDIETLQQICAIAKFVSSKEEYVKNLGRLGKALKDKKMYDEAISVTCEAMEIAPENDDLQDCKQFLASILLETGKFREGEMIIREVLDYYTQNQPDSKEVPVLMVLLGRLCIKQAKFDEGSLFYREAISQLRDDTQMDLNKAEDFMKNMLNKGYLYFAEVLAEFALVLKDKLGLLVESSKIGREAHDLFVKLYGPDCKGAQETEFWQTFLE